MSEVEARRRASATGRGDGYGTASSHRTAWWQEGTLVGMITETDLLAAFIDLLAAQGRAHQDRADDRQLLAPGATAVVEAILSAGTEVVQEGERVQIIGLDRFTVRQKHKRAGRNLNIGQAISRSHDVLSLQGAQDP